MKTKDKIRNNKDKDKKIILWEVKSFQAIEINKREEEFKDVSIPTVCKLWTQEPENFDEEVMSLVTAWWFHKYRGSKESSVSYRSVEQRKH